MTREEAIECLSERVSIGKMCEQSCMVGFGVNIDTLDEAFDMAISALRQQKTMTDSHQMTNADSIRAMNDEELAKLMRSMMDCVSCGKMFSFKCDGSYEHCLSVCLNWL